MLSFLDGQVDALLIMRFGVEVLGNLKTVCCLILRFFGEIITVFYVVIFGWSGRCLSDYEFYKAFLWFWK
jgi:hypothetical protein